MRGRGCLVESITDSEDSSLEDSVCSSLDGSPLQQLLNALRVVLFYY